MNGMFDEFRHNATFGDKLAGCAKHFHYGNDKQRKIDHPNNVVSF